MEGSDLCPMPARLKGSDSGRAQRQNQQSSGPGVVSRSCVQRSGSEVGKEIVLRVGAERVGQAQG